jgi:hypothetical protein
MFCRTVKLCWLRCVTGTFLVTEGRKLFPRGPHVLPALLYDILGRLELCREEPKTSHGNSVGIVGLVSGQA